MNLMLRTELTNHKRRGIGEKKEKALPRLSHKKEKRDKVIRIRSYNYDRLAKLGTISEDFDDALTKVLDYWEKTTIKEC